jgi:hypothetical protein
LIVQFGPFNAKAGREVQLEVGLANEDQIAGSKTLAIRATGPSGTEVFSRTETVEARF